MLRSFLSIAQEWSIHAVFLRLALATLVGTIIGMEREYRNKDAGVKTHVLVCIGAAMTVIVNEYIFQLYPNSNIDITRIGAQVVSGVGFLGVGTILVTGKNEVRGLTTAAGLWACACIGLAAGAGFVEGTVLAMIFVVFTFVVLSRIDRYMRHNAKSFDLYIEFEDRSGVKQLLKILHTWECSYHSFVLMKGEASEMGTAATLTIEIPATLHKTPFIEAVQALEFVSFVDEM